jgi:hypothetical protein
MSIHMRRRASLQETTRCPDKGDFVAVKEGSRWFPCQVTACTVKLFSCRRTLDGREYRISYTSRRWRWITAGKSVLPGASIEVWKGEKWLPARVSHAEAGHFYTALGDVRYLLSEEGWRWRWPWPVWRDLCVVKGCQSVRSEEFKGDLCPSCWSFLSQGLAGDPRLSSQAGQNALAAAWEVLSARLRDLLLSDDDFMHRRIFGHQLSRLSAYGKVGPSPKGSCS